MRRDNNHWAVVDLLKTTSSFFQSKEIENPRLNAEYLLAHTLGLTRVQLYLQFDRVLLADELTSYREQVKRRIAREPLQYIVGNTEFMGLTFSVDRSVLIPRPETELLVETVLELKSHFDVPPRIWDIGTGSGCIAISLAKMWPGTQILASDISDDALTLARQNAIENGVAENMRFEQNDILNDDPPDVFDIVISNPPYVTEQEFCGLDKEIREHEPQVAVTDFADGTVFYDRIMQLIAAMPECKFGFLELSGTGTDRYLALLKKYQINKYEISKDLGGKDRLLKIQQYHDEKK